MVKLNEISLEEQTYMNEYAMETGKKALMFGKRTEAYLAWKEASNEELIEEQLAEEFEEQLELGFEEEPDTTLEKEDMKSGIAEVITEEANARNRFDWSSILEHMSSTNAKSIKPKEFKMIPTQEKILKILKKCPGEYIKTAVIRDTIKMTNMSALRNLKVLSEQGYVSGNRLSSGWVWTVKLNLK